MVANARHTSPRSSPRRSRSCPTSACSTSPAAAATGAIAAARRAWGNTVGVDFVPALLERGRERAAAERLEVEFVEGDAAGAALRGRRASTSRCRSSARCSPPTRSGPRPSSSASVKPGGRIGMANWVPDGGVGAIFVILVKHTAAAARLTRRSSGAPRSTCAGCSATGSPSCGPSAASPPGLPLGRPLPRVLPRLLRPAEERLRAGRPGGRGGAEADLREYLEESNTAATGRW